MKSYWVIGTVLVFSILTQPSCDLVVQPVGKGLNSGELLIQALFNINNPGYWHCKDEVNVYDNGTVTIVRLEGDPISESSRYLSDDELKHLMRFLDDFGKLKDSYLRDENEDEWVYSVTYFGDGEKKTVTCDNSIYDYLTADPTVYNILRPIVIILSDVRLSLIGEGKYSGKLEFNLRPEKTVMDLDEEIVLIYQVFNSSRQDIFLQFANQQQLGYKVYHNGNFIAEYPLAVLPALSSWIIPAGHIREQRVSWSQTIHNDGYEFSDKRAKSGVYTIVQYLLDGNSPYRATDITITENGDTPLQARAIKSIMKPQVLIYELNNRISEEFVFTFDINKPVGYKIISLESGKVVRADSTESPGSSRIPVEPYGDYAYSIPWNGRDYDGNFLRGKYRLEMWMIGQDPDYRAFREFWEYW
jgi:hypothetical protein